MNPISEAESPAFAVCASQFDVLEYLATGMTTDEVLLEFPDLTREDIQACLDLLPIESVLP